MCGSAAKAEKEIRNAVNDTSKAVRDTVGQAERNVRAAGSDTSDWVRDTAASGVTNIERNIQQDMKGMAAILSGKWDNAGRSFLDAYLRMSGATFLTNPDDITNATGLQTLEERMGDQAMKEASLAEAAAIEKEREQLRDQIADMLSGVTGRRRAGATGRANVRSVLSSEDLASTLLTARG